MIRNHIAAERRALADLLDGLSAAEWDGPSLCDGWAVRHVVAHLTVPFRYSRARFVVDLVKAGGRFNRMADTTARRDAALPRPLLIAALRDNAEHPWTPPGGDHAAALTHDVVHGLDITRPLGVERDIPAEAMAAVLGTLTTPRSWRFFGVDLDGVELRAADLDWTYGSGRPVSGRAQDLALLLTGRPAPAGAFAGAGADSIVVGATGDDRRR
ncbi:MAG TPA: maleylpyruvate isomerase family mycothiol-dependent enzyme [Acidimicrobiales bacterium]